LDGKLFVNQCFYYPYFLIDPLSISNQGMMKVLKRTLGNMLKDVKKMKKIQTMKALERMLRM
jgi:hypothetical protein